MPKKDLNQLAKFLVDQATGETVVQPENAAATLGRLGGKARAAKLSKEELSASARNANAVRWAKKKPPAETDAQPPKPQSRRGVIRPVEE